MDFKKLIYKQNDADNTMRISKTKVITIIVFIIFFAWSFPDFLNDGLLSALITAILVGLIMAIPTFVVGWVIGKLLNKIVSPKNNVNYKNTNQVMSKGNNKNYDYKASKEDKIKMINKISDDSILAEILVNEREYWVPDIILNRISNQEILINLLREESRSSSVPGYCFKLPDYINDKQALEEILKDVNNPTLAGSIRVRINEL